MSIEVGRTVTVLKNYARVPEKTQGIVVKGPYPAGKEWLWVKFDAFENPKLMRPNEVEPLVYMGMEI